MHFIYFIGLHWNLDLIQDKEKKKKSQLHTLVTTSDCILPTIVTYLDNKSIIGHHIAQTIFICMPRSLVEVLCLLTCFCSLRKDLSFHIRSQRLSHNFMSVALFTSVFSIFKMQIDDDLTRSQAFQAFCKSTSCLKTERNDSSSAGRYYTWLCHICVKL